MSIDAKGEWDILEWSSLHENALSFKEEIRTWDELELVFEASGEVSQVDSPNVGNFTVIEEMDGGFKAKSTGLNSKMFEATCVRHDGVRRFEEWGVDEIEEEVLTAEQLEITLKLIPPEDKNYDDGHKTSLGSLYDEANVTDSPTDRQFEFDFNFGNVVTERVTSDVTATEDENPVSVEFELLLTDPDSVKVVEENLGKLGSVTEREIPDGVNVVNDSNEDGRNRVTVKRPANQGTKVNDTFSIDGEYIVKEWETIYEGNGLYRVVLNAYLDKKIEPPPPPDGGDDDDDFGDEDPVANLRMRRASGEGTNPEVGELISFDGLDSEPPTQKIGIESYTWNMGDGTVKSGDQFNYTYDSTGSYRVMLTVTAGNGKTDSDSEAFTVVEKEDEEDAVPKARITATSDQLTVGETVAFDGSDSFVEGGKSDIVSYEWSFGDGGSDTGITTNYQYSESGEYTVTLTVTDEYGNADSATMVVDVDRLVPVADFDYPSPVKEGDSVAFDASPSEFTEGSIVSYSWSFGDGDTGSGESPNHTYESAGRYNVTLTVVGDNGNSDSTTQLLEVNRDLASTPNAVIDASTQRELTERTITFDASGSTMSDGSITSYEWNFGNGDSDTGVVGDTSFSSEGTYTVTLTVTADNGNTDVATVDITIEEGQPTAVAQADFASVNYGESVGFDGSASTFDRGSITSYEWSFTDGGSATGPTPTHTFDSPGQHQATLTVTADNGNTDTDQVGVEVVEQTEPAGPSADIDADQDMVRVGETITFDASGSSAADGVTIQSYDWEFGDGNTGTGVTEQHEYLSGGMMTAVVTVTDDNGKKDTAFMEVQVDDGSEVNPTAGISVSDSSTYVYTQITFDASSSSFADGYTPSESDFEWSFGDGETATGESVTHRYGSVGSYVATVTVTGEDGMTDSARVEVSVDPRGDVTAGFIIDPDTPLVGEQVTFDAATSELVGEKDSISSYEWQFGDGETGTGEVVTHTYDRAGSFSVTLDVVADSGERDRATQELVVDPQPSGPTAVADANPMQVIIGEKVTFDGSGSSPSTADDTIQSWDWSFGDGSNSSAETIQYSYQQSGEFDVTLTVTDDTGASDSDTLTVLVEEDYSPTANFTVTPDTINPGDTVTLDASSSSFDQGNITDYTWTLGDGSTASGEVVEHQYDTDGFFDVTLTVTGDNGAVDSELYTVEVADDSTGDVSIEANISTNPNEVVAGDPMTFDASASTVENDTIAEYNWSFGNGDTRTGESVDYVYDEGGSYTVTLTVVSGGGFTDSTTTDVSITSETPPNPVIEYTPENPDPGQDIQFDASNSTIDVGSISSYEWSFGDGGNTSGETVTYSYGNDGEYRVILSVVSDSGEVNSVEEVVTVGQGEQGKPNAYIRADPTIAEGGECVLFDGSKSQTGEGQITSTRWDFKDGSESFDLVTIHDFDKKGVYEVELTVTNSAGLSDTDTQTVEITSDVDDSDPPGDKGEYDAKVVAASGSPSGIGLDSATIYGGLVQTENVTDVEVWFEYGKNDFSNEIGRQTLTEGSVVSVDLTGLDVDTSYQYRFKAQAEAEYPDVGDPDSSTSMTRTFTTLQPDDADASVSVVTGPTDGVTETNATLYGVVDTLKNTKAAAFFEFWKKGNPGNSTRRSLGQISSEGLFEEELTTLDGYNTYVYKFYVETEDGLVVEGNEREFTAAVCEIPERRTPVDGTLYTLGNQGDGVMLWSHDTGTVNQNWSTEVLQTDNDLSTYVTGHVADGDKLIYQDPDGVVHGIGEGWSVDMTEQFDGVPSDSVTLEATPDVHTSAPVFGSQTVWVSGTYYIDGKDPRRVESKGMVAAIDKISGDVKWSLELPSVAETPIINSGKMYVPTDAGLYKIDAETTEVEWFYNSGGKAVTSVSLGVENVFVLAKPRKGFDAESWDDKAGYEVRAVEPGNGEENWATPVDGFCGGITSSGERVYAACYKSTADGPREGVTAIRNQTGNSIWEFWTESDQDRLPAPPTIVNDGVAVFGSSTAIHFLDQTAGSELRTRSVDGAVQSPPTVVDNTVFVVEDVDGTGDNRIKAFDLDTDETFWQNDIVADGSRSATHVNSGLSQDSIRDQTSIFGTVVEDTITSTPVTRPTISDNGKVVYVTNGGEIRCVSEDGSQEYWNADLVTDDIVGSPVVSNGQVYVPVVKDQSTMEDGRVISWPLDGGTPDWEFSDCGAVPGGVAIDGTSAYVVDADGILHTFDAEKGFPKGVELDVTQRDDEFVMGSPVIHSESDMLYIGTVIAEMDGDSYKDSVHSYPYPKSVGGRVVAVDKWSYEVEWSVELDNGVFNSPVVDDDRVYVGAGTTENDPQTTPKLYAFNRSDGSEVWTHDMGNKGLVVGSPVKNRGKIVVNEPSESTQDQIGISPFSSVRHLDAETGDVVWESDFDVQSSGGGGGLVSYGLHIYATVDPNIPVNDTGMQTGFHRYRDESFDMNHLIHSPSTATVSDRAVFVPGVDGGIVAFGTKGGLEQWSRDYDPTTNVDQGFSGSSVLSPTYVEGDTSVGGRIQNRIGGQTPSAGYEDPIIQFTMEEMTTVTLTDGEQDGAELVLDNVAVERTGASVNKVDDAEEGESVVVDASSGSVDFEFMHELVLEQGMELVMEDGSSVAFEGVVVSVDDSDFIVRDDGSLDMSDDSAIWIQESGN